jgi:hypothetical protein
LLASLMVPAAVQADTASASPSPPDARASDVADLDGLLSACAKMPGLVARFNEEKQIALLAVPLRSSGTLHFARGRGLVRHTAPPSKQSVLVTDKELVFWDGKAVKRVSLASSATVDAFARSFSMILAADRAGLEKSFSIDFARGGGSWTLKLVPKGADLKNVIGSIELEGRGVVLSTLKVREANGDVSTTRFTDVDTAKRYTDEEADRLFRLPPP